MSWWGNMNIGQHLAELKTGPCIRVLQMKLFADAWHSEVLALPAEISVAPIALTAILKPALHHGTKCYKRVQQKLSNFTYPSALQRHVVVSSNHA